jgi:hypothetical protein
MLPIPSFAQFTGYQEDFIAGIASQIRKAELWVGDSVCYERWADDEPNDFIKVVPFWMDELVAEGGYFIPRIRL